MGEVCRVSQEMRGREECSPLQIFSLYIIPVPAKPLTLAFGMDGLRSSIHLKEWLLVWKYSAISFASKFRSQCSCRHSRWHLERTWVAYMRFDFMPSTLRVVITRFSVFSSVFRVCPGLLGRGLLLKNQPNCCCFWTPACLAL